MCRDEARDATKSVVILLYRRMLFTTYDTVLGVLLVGS